ncbi:MAG: UDP-N-acetylmuramoyl-tripeptide--D-alanyl-D-alanine ligase [Terriglobales bacterium]
MKLPLGRIAGFINAAGTFDREALATGYSIDSRTVAAGDLFFAVRGERLDGHEFVMDALAKGAVGAVVREDQAYRYTDYSDYSRLLIVDEPLVALQTLGASVRGVWGKPLIAVTGSAGKTTTKEIIARLLATRYRVLKTEGNLNNHFGLPLQLLRLEPEQDIAVIELGMSHPGEITALALLAQPNVGVVTNVAPVHLGFFKSVGEIAKAKKELIDTLTPNGVAILNADDEYVSQFGREYRGRVITYGARNPADVRAEGIEPLGEEGSRFVVVTTQDYNLVRLPLIGRHNVYNALAAIAVAMQYGIGAGEAAVQLASLSPVDKRGQVLRLGGATVVNDCYNSNPRALDSMVDALVGMKPGPGGRRIVVAGEMLELGPAGDDLHRRGGQHMVERGVDVLIGVRGLAKLMVEGARQARDKANPAKPVQADFVESPEMAGEWLARNVRAGDVVLLKASRGVRLERALDVWRAKSEAPAERVIGSAGQRVSG